MSDTTPVAEPTDLPAGTITPTPDPAEREVEALQTVSPNPREVEHEDAEAVKLSVWLPMYTTAFKYTNEFGSTLVIDRNGTLVNPLLADDIVQSAARSGVTLVRN